MVSCVGLSDPGIADPECTVDENTTYTVTGTDANGCVNTDDVFISVNYLPDVDAIASPYTIDVYLGETSILDVLDRGINFVWSPPTGLSDPNSQNPVVSGIPDTIVYTVTVTDINGCVNTDTVQVNAIGELVAGLPTAFSPNGDGCNDFYAPVLDGSGDLEIFFFPSITAGPAGLQQHCYPWMGRHVQRKRPSWGGVWSKNLPLG